MAAKQITFLIICTVLLACFVNSASRENAVDSITRAEQDIASIEQYGLSANYMRDLLDESRKTLKRADLMIELNTNASGGFAEQAKTALEGLETSDFTYDHVILLTEDISSKKQEIIAIYDRLRAVELLASENKQLGVDVSRAQETIAMANKSFQAEHYDEASDLIAQANSELDKEIAQSTTIKVIADSSKNYFAKNWKVLTELFLALVCLMITSGIFIIRNRRNAKIKKMHDEKKALQELIKKAQDERYRKGTLSYAEYEVKIGVYQKKLDHAERYLSVYSAKHKK